MKDYIKNFKDRAFLVEIFEALFMLGLSLVINFFAGTYATEKVSNYVTDIILSNTKTYDVENVFVYGSVVLLFFIIFVLLYHPKKIPFAVKSIALFIVIRSLFISLTHLGPYPNQVALDMGHFLSKFIFGGDLFFSGHTGLPFLMALIFWKNKYLKWSFIALSFIFAITVLLGHLHYSIDVLAAFFITYAIFHMAEYMFGKNPS